MHLVTLDVFADLVRSVESDKPAVRRAQDSLRTLMALEAESLATVEEVEDVIERLLHPGIVGGAAAAGLALLVGGLLSLRRREHEQADEADRALHEMEVSRRELLGLIGVASLGAGDLLRRDQLPAMTSPSPSGEPVNVLAIVIDDLNDYPTFMGGAPMNVSTPNLDALAAESRTFLNHHVTVPICAPSRSTLMWGFDVAMHEQTAADLNYEQHKEFSERWANESLIAMARRGGVSTYGGGKVFHVDQHQARWTQFVSTNWPTSDPKWAVGFDHGPLLDDRNPDEDLTSAMIDALTTHEPGEPFLMMPGYRLPHLPWRVPQRFLDMYPLDGIELPETPEDDWSDLGPVATAQLEQVTALGRGWFQVVEEDYDRRKLMQAYLASMTHTDTMVGRLVEELNSSPHSESTVVMLVSDNGYHQGENFAYRKLTLRSQATRTPFLVRGAPGADFTPAQLTRPLSSTSFMPTIADLLRLESTIPRPGTSLRNDQLPAPVAISYVHNSVSVIYDDGASAWRWTLHFLPGQEFDVHRLTVDDVAEMELYNLKTDPSEFDNLYAS